MAGSKRVLTTAAVAILLGGVVSARMVWAEETGVEGSTDSCPASNVIGTGIISNICWSCIFPLKISGITIFGNSQPEGKETAELPEEVQEFIDEAGNAATTAGFPLSSKPKAPDDAADKVVCICNNEALPTAGVPIGMWLPSDLYETTLVPGCSSTLGGAQIGIADELYRGSFGDPTNDIEQQTFNHIHTYSYPIVMMMELFTKCSSSYTDIDLLYMSEIDPMWNDPLVALYGNPVSVFGASIVAQAACAADAISASLGKPIDGLFWCGGAWTSSLAPYMGIEHGVGPVQFSSATSLKLLAMDSARGLARRRVGNDALCEAQYQPMVKRSHYRWQVAWPVAEATRNHGSGESLLRWGWARTVPGYADMPIYLRWSWTDCCATLFGG